MWKQLQKDLIEIFSDKVIWQPIPAPIDRHIFQYDQHSFYINKRLSKSEILLIKKLIYLYSVSDAPTDPWTTNPINWFRKIWMQEKTPTLDERELRFPWKQYLYFYLKLVSSMTSEQQQSCTNLIESYFPDNGIHKMMLSMEEWMILLNVKALDIETDTDTWLEIAKGFIYELEQETGQKSAIIIYPPMSNFHEMHHLKQTILDTSVLNQLLHSQRQVQPVWKMQVEKLVTSLSHGEAKSFLEQNQLFTILTNSNLKKSLEVYFDLNTNISETAKQLYIHRNTFIYRLNKIKEICQLDPRNFTDAVILYFSILLYETFFSQNH